MTRKTLEKTKPALEKIPLSLLIVDDHQMICDGIRVMLETVKSKYEFKIHYAITSDAAIQEIQKNKFDIILMDYKLSTNLTGADCIKEILALKPKSKILAISSHDEYVFMKNMIDAGALGYVLKNISPVELVWAIETILNGHIYYSKDVVSSFIKTGTTTSSATTPVVKLKKRELEILKLIADEYTNEEIAKKLFLAKTTINEYRQSLLEKFEVKNTAGLIRKAAKLNFI